MASILDRIMPRPYTAGTAPERHAPAGSSPPNSAEQTAQLAELDDPGPAPGGAPWPPHDTADPPDAGADVAPHPLPSSATDQPPPAMHRPRPWRIATAAIDSTGTLAPTQTQLVGRQPDRRRLLLSYVPSVGTVVVYIAPTREQLTVNAAYPLSASTPLELMTTEPIYVTCTGGTAVVQALLELEPAAEAPAL